MKMEMAMMVKQFDGNKESIKIISVAAFCFSIVSCITTATGLGEFVFTDKQAWQAILISFSVQSILFVFNLRLPGYFAKINKNIRTKFKVFRPIKILILDFIFVALYLAVLVASSLFSFVYIFDAAYLSRDISYIDADIILTNEYSKALEEYNNYVDEEMKAIQINLLLKITELKDTLPPTDTDKSDFDKLEQNVQETQAAYDLAQTNREGKEKEIEAYQQIIDTYPVNIFGITPIVQEATENMNKASQELVDLKTKESETKNTLNAAKKAFNEREESKEDSANEFLVGFLKNSVSDSSDMSKEYLDTAMNKLTEMIEKYADVDDMKSSYGEMAQLVQSIYMTKEEYVTLQNVLKDETSLSIEPIKLPNVNETTDIIRWRNDWITRYESLEDNINNTPPYIGLYNDDYEGKNIINEEILKKYNPITLTEQLDIYKREYLTDINKIEKSWELLFDNDGKYPFNVRFSAVFAVFLDISSLAVGMFIYYYDLNKNSEDGN